MKTWVQHLSGIGEKWEVTEEQNPFHWVARQFAGTYLYLPRTEYHVCEPPERWVDVTEQCEATPTNWPSEKYSASNGIMSKDELMLWVCREDHATGYRLRKVKLNKAFDDQWAFIVEKKEPA